MDLRSSQNLNGIVILAAGAGSRMGQAKQTLPWQGMSLVKYVVQKVIQAKGFLKPIVVTGAFEKEVFQEIADTNVDIVHNASWKEGMAGSLRTGLKKLLKMYPDLYSVCFILADQPMIETEGLEKFLDTFKNSGKWIVASDYGKNGGPPAIFHKSLFRELMQLKGDSGAKKLILKYDSNCLKIEFPGTAADLDTLEDYEDLKRRTKETDT